MDAEQKADLSAIILQESATIEPYDFLHAGLVKSPVFSGFSNISDNNYF